MLLLCFHSVELCGVRLALVERCVRSRGVIKTGSGINDLFGLKTVGDFRQVNGLVFEGTPKPFDEDVVQGAASAIH